MYHQQLSLSNSQQAKLISNEMLRVTKTATEDDYGFLVWTVISSKGYRSQTKPYTVIFHTTG